MGQRVFQQVDFGGADFIERVKGDHSVIALRLREARGIKEGRRREHDLAAVGLAGEGSHVDDLHEVAVGIHFRDRLALEVGA